MIGQQLSVMARRYPTATAVVCDERRLDYAALEARCDRLAAALAARGARRGERVAGLLYNGIEFVELFFACARIGAVFVPLNFRLTAAEIRAALALCEPRVLVAGTEFASVLDDLDAHGDLPAALLLVGDGAAEQPGPARGVNYERAIAEHAPLEALPELALDDPQLILHSSGTTGEPKGAVWAQATTWCSALAKIVDFRIAPSDVAVVFGPLFHVGPLMDFAVPVLLCGGTLVLGRSRGFEPGRLIETLARERGTIVTVYPTLWRRVLDAPELERFDARHLRILSTGGEPIGVPVLEAIYRRFPDVGFVNTYGSTEGGPITTFLAPEHRVERIGSVGKPAFGVDVRVVDEQGRELAADETGELVVRSPFVCRGYWNRPDLTAQALRRGWWHTGDLACIDADGFIWIAGRAKDMVITGAENVYPAEVEQVLVRLEGVAECAVIGVPDEAWGERLVAFVATARDAAVTAESIDAHCRESLAGYKVPREVVFIEALPRTATNKVSRESLRALYASGANTAG